MKKILLLFLLVISISGCDIFAQNPVNSYDLSFAPNQDNPTGYKLYAWEGPDTTVFDTTQLAYVGFFNHDSLVQIYGGAPTDTLKLVDVYPSAENGEWLIMALKAVNTAGLESGFALSPFYHKAFITKPLLPKVYRIQK